MGSRDAEEMLVVAKAEVARLERELDALATECTSHRVQHREWTEQARAEVARLEAENAELREMLGNYTREYPLECNKRVKAEAERDALAASLAAVREARSGHPECDVHPEGDPVSCGWKRAVLDIDAALSAVPSEVLRSRDEKTWDEGLDAGRDRWMDAREFGDPPVNPHRRVQEGDNRG
jgi:hypothetical protein